MEITIDDFKKLEIRIGTILSAEPVEGSEKLLKLEVGFGEFKRQILAGIAKFYTLEQLVGKQCPFLVNLEPKKMIGLESQGMLLATDAKGQPILLHPEKQVPQGSTIK